LLYRNNSGASADDTMNGYTRQVAGGGSTTSSRWLSNEGCLPLCEKAACVLYYSTWRIWVNRCRLLHRCAGISRAYAPAAAAAWKRDVFKFLCFAVKTVGCAAKW
jgi:hypothetical protein